jgi:hypothetical protein
MIYAHGQIAGGCGGSHALVSKAVDQGDAAANSTWECIVIGRASMGLTNMPLVPVGGIQWLHLASVRATGIRTRHVNDCLSMSREEVVEASLRAFAVCGREPRCPCRRLVLRHLRRFFAFPFNRVDEHSRGHGHRTAKALKIATI